MVLDKFSDYGSGSSSNSTISWSNQEPWVSIQPSQGLHGQKSSSFLDLVTGKCSFEDALEEFRLNGSDSPYNPEEDKIWGTNQHQIDNFVGMGPSSVYLRQKSWPEPDRTPAVQLPRPKSDWIPSSNATDFIPNLVTPPRTEEPMDIVPATARDVLSSEQLRVLSSLPDAVLYSLLRDLEQERGLDKKHRAKRTNEECRFCKNNGERESYYRGHSLKCGGRVQCPVLRAFVCRRCGASGDTAHTIKYCPLSTNEERLKSAAMMRSVRLASGRRRAPPLNPYNPHHTPDYIVFGAPSPAALVDNGVYNAYTEAAPLDPLWAALEQKLML